MHVLVFYPLLNIQCFMDMICSRAFYALKRNVTSIVNFQVFRTGIFQQSSEFEHCVVNIRTQFLQPWRFRQCLPLRYQHQPTNYRTSKPRILQFHQPPKNKTISWPMFVVDMCQQATLLCCPLWTVRTLKLWLFATL